MKKITLITAINLILLTNTMILRFASKVIDTNSIRFLFVAYYIKESILLYLVLVIVISFFVTKDKMTKAIDIVGSILTLILLVILFKGLAPW